MGEARRMTWNEVKEARRKVLQSMLKALDSGTEEEFQRLHTELFAVGVMWRNLKAEVLKDDKRDRA